MHMYIVNLATLDDSKPTAPISIATNPWCMGMMQLLSLDSSTLPLTLTLYF